jgi:hypothetical protein
MTPRPSPSPVDVTIQPASSDRGNVSIPSASWSDNMIYHISDRTPWRPFMQFIDSLHTEGPLQILCSPRNTNHSNPLINDQSWTNTSYPKMELYTEMIQGIGESLIKSWHDAFLRATLWNRFNEGKGTIHFEACIRPQPYLPPKEGSSEIDVPAIMDLSTRSSQLELLKHAVHLVANNFDARHMASVVVELAQNKHNRVLLQSLLDQKLLMVDAFVEKLLLPAVSARNKSLLELILRAGCDVNQFREKEIDTGNEESALSLAIGMQDQKLVSLLLDNGANGSLRLQRHFQRDSLLYVSYI